MKILIRAFDNVVIYAQDDLVLTDKNVYGDNWHDNNFTNDNAIIVDAILPDIFCGAVYTYIDGTWAVWDAKRYDEITNPKIDEPLTIQATIPDVVTMRQARLALLQNDLLDAVDMAVATMTKDVQITWEYATEVRRDNQLVASIKELMLWTDEQIDELFVLAGAL